MLAMVDVILVHTKFLMVLLPAYRQPATGDLSCGCQCAQKQNPLHLSKGKVVTEANEDRLLNHMILWSFEL